MWYITADSGQKRPQPTLWSHEAMLVQVIDLGTQPWSDKYPEPKRKLELMFEILDESWDFNGDQKPFAVWQYTSPYISYNKDKITNYHKLINQLFWSKTHDEAGKVDFEEILGTVYMIQIKENNWFVNIDSITKGTAKMQEAYKNHTPFNTKFVFSLEEFNQNLFDWLREKVQEKIKNSPEYQELQKKKLEVEDTEWTAPDTNAEELPF